MPYETNDPVIQNVETLLSEAFRASVKNDSKSDLTAMILANGALCIHLKPAENDVKKLVDALVTFDIIHRSWKSSLEDTDILLKSSNDELVEAFTDEFLFKKDNFQIDMQHIRCESPECKLLVKRFEDLGVKIHTDSKDKNLTEFVNHFESLCLKHGVLLLAGQSDYAIRQCIGENIVGEAPEYYYQFNVLPEDMHKILMSESNHYAGYHYDGSVLRLHNPNSIILKEGVMCIFPVFPTEDDKVILRNAGCNIVDVLATQLSFYIRNFLHPDLPINDCYGHRGAPIVDKYADYQELINAAKKSLGTTWDYEDAQSGVSEISICSKNLVDIDQAAYQIYNRLSAVSSDEFDNLKSVEVPIETYLEALIDIKKLKLEYLFDYLQTLQATVLQAKGNDITLKIIKYNVDQINEIRESIIPELQKLIQLTKKQDKEEDDTLFIKNRI